jgi:protein-L-isoaspartate(D-aspartate) O-methyltransferase
MDTFDTSHGFYARQRNVMETLQHRRERMVEFQIARRGVHDARLLAAMREVPRESFVSKEMEEFAYDDRALPIDEGQSISQPYIVAMMIEAAEIDHDDHVLEVGAGSGYAAAVVSRMTAEVYAIERHATLVESAAKRFAALGYDNIRLRVGDGTRGWPEAAPFDAILVAASAPEIPPALKEQLVIGGRLVIPIGEHRWGQSLRKVTRVCQTDYELKDLGAVACAPDRRAGLAWWRASHGEHCWISPETTAHHSGTERRREDAYCGCQRDRGQFSGDGRSSLAIAMAVETGERERAPTRTGPGD